MGVTKQKEERYFRLLVKLYFSQYIKGSILSFKKRSQEGGGVMDFVKELGGNPHSGSDLAFQFVKLMIEKGAIKYHTHGEKLHRNGGYDLYVIDKARIKELLCESQLFRGVYALIKQNAHETGILIDDFKI